MCLRDTSRLDDHGWCKRDAAKRSRPAGWLEAAWRGVKSINAKALPRLKNVRHRVVSQYKFAMSAFRPKPISFAVDWNDVYRPEAGLDDENGFGRCQLAN